jgi:choline monooxygenase
MGLERIEIDRDPARAHTLPREAYGDPAWFAEQVERVLSKAWHRIGDETLVPTAGSIVPVEWLPGTVAEPLVLTRDEQGEVACLSNVCTHRGNVLVHEPTKGSAIRCGYHGRCFGLDGCVLAAPGFDGTEGFPEDRDALPRAALGQWCGQLFAALDPAIPFESWIGAARDFFSWAPIEQMAFDPDSRRDFVVEAHWALYVENYLEGFHVPYVHGGLATALDLSSYETRPLPHGVLQVGYAAKGEPAFEPPVAPPGASRRIAALWLWLFPTTMLNLYPWGLSVNVVAPMGPRRSRVTFLSYVFDPAARSRGAGGDLLRVEKEDEAVVESVQRGVRSRLYQNGRYAPGREEGVHRFHRLLAAAWNGDAFPPP